MARSVEVEGVRPVDVNEAAAAPVVCCAALYGTGFAVRGADRVASARAL